MGYLMAEYKVRILTCILLLVSGCARSQKPAVDSTSSDGSMNQGFVIPVDLGVLHQGESREYRCWIDNGAASPSEIVRFDSMCECVTLRLQSVLVGPGRQRLLTIHYDGESDPDFAGSLGIIAVARNRKGHELGRVTIAVDVISSEQIEPK
jgi:hypothetical protein